MPTAEDYWMEWLTEGQRVVTEWESARGGRLAIADAAVLTDRLARALQDAFDRGRLCPLPTA